MGALDNFARIWLQPTATLLRTASSELERAVAASTFLECRGWLSVYVQAQICPAAARVSLIQRFFEGITISYELLRNLGIWPEHVIEVAKRLQQPGSRSDETVAELGNPVAFRSPIQLCASMAADLVFSDAEKAFASLVFFSKQHYWESFLKEPPSPAGLAWALSGRADSWLDGNRNLAFAGLVKTVEHTNGLSHLLLELQQSQNHEDWVNFREGVTSAHNWRLNPREGAQVRYDQMVAVVDDLITAGLKQEDPMRMQTSFAEEARKSLALWRQVTGPKEMVAGGF